MMPEYVYQFKKIDKLPKPTVTTSPKPNAPEEM